MKISQKITELLLRDKLIQQEDMEIYLFGLHELLIEIPIIFIPIVVSYVLGVFFDYCVFLILFFSIRPYIGGYHAKTRIACIVKSIILCTCVVGLIIYIQDYVFNNVFLAVILGGVILITSPVSNKIELFDRRKMKLKVYVIICSVLILMIMVLRMRIYKGIAGVTAAFLVLALLLIVQIIKNWYSKAGENENQRSF